MWVQIIIVAKATYLLIAMRSAKKEFNSTRLLAAHFESLTYMYSLYRLFYYLFWANFLVFCVT